MHDTVNSSYALISEYLSSPCSQRKKEQGGKIPELFSSLVTRANVYIPWFWGSFAWALQVEIWFIDHQQMTLIHPCKIFNCLSVHSPVSCCVTYLNRDNNLLSPGVSLHFLGMTHGNIATVWYKIKSLKWGYMQIYDIKMWRGATLSGKVQTKPNYRHTCYICIKLYYIYLVNTTAVRIMFRDDLNETSVMSPSSVTNWWMT